jgi:hypothetical protein
VIAVRGFLVAGHGGQQLFRFGRRRLQRFELCRGLIHREHLRVAALLIRHRVVEGARPAPVPHTRRVLTNFGEDPEHPGQPSVLHRPAHPLATLEL